ncbi:hypothetical protein Q7P35_008244 [Cladosporium inversicolor]
MAKIGVGIIGLSAGGGWASIAHLPYLLQSDKYELVALTNSSVDSARQSATTYALEDVELYDSVDDMVKSARVQLVVCAVAVFSHYSLIKPAILAKKDVYVEWPLGATTEEAEELERLAQAHKVKTIVGLQGRGSNVISTLQGLVRENAVGKLLSSHMCGSAMTGETGNELSKRYAYFKDKFVEGCSGQIMLSIYLGHTLDTMAMVVGEPATVSTELQTTWPRVSIIDNGKTLESDVEKTADDLGFLHGRTVDGVAYAYAMRGGEAFTPSEAFCWEIVGDKGSIRVTGSTIMLNLGAEDYKIRVKDNSSKKIREVDLSSPLGSTLPLPAQNVGRLYERFADKEAVPTFSDAVKRHHFLDSIFQSSEKGVVAKVNLQ